MKIAAVVILAAVVSAASAQALTFPESCRTPPGTVTDIWGLNSEKATMSGQHTQPDIIFACTAGYVHQGTQKTADCVAFYEDENIFVKRLDAQANCAKGVIAVNGNLTVFPIQPMCANGGFQAIKAFNILCPSSDLKLEQ